MQANQAKQTISLVVRPKQERFMLMLIAAITFACLAACGGGGGGGSPSASAPPSNPAPQNPSPTVDPLYLECVSNVPVNSGDANKPVITLAGARVINHALGTRYVDPGASAVDPREGDISSMLVVSGLSELNSDVVGDYLIRYNIKNSAQLSATEAVRVVRVNSGEFAAQTARDIGTTSGRMGYYEHLPTNYSDDPDQTFPLIIYQHGWFNARFLDSSTVQAPLSILENGNLVKIIKDGLWDESLPFIVLSPQRCVDPLDHVVTPAQTKRFIDYAINTYKVDISRIYMGGHSQGSGNTWNYVATYPQQLAAVFPIAGGYGTATGCALKDTPAWAFIGRYDATVPYDSQVETVNSINACDPQERARITVLDRVGHNDIERPVLGLTGLGEGLAPYDVYDQRIYDWLLMHSRP